MKEHIKIYKMTYQKCTNESASMLFMDNNYISRKLFIQMVRDDIDMELNSFKKYCLSDIKNDLFSLYEEIHKENHFYLNSMESEFIKNGKANYDNQIFLSVVEISVFKII